MNFCEKSKKFRNFKKNFFDLNGLDKLKKVAEKADVSRNCY